MNDNSHPSPHVAQLADWGGLLGDLMPPPLPEDSLSSRTKKVSKESGNPSQDFVMGLMSKDLEMVKKSVEAGAPVSKVTGQKTCLFLINYFDPEIASYLLSEKVSFLDQSLLLQIIKHDNAEYLDWYLTHVVRPEKTTFFERFEKNLSAAPASYVNQRSGLAKMLMTFEMGLDWQWERERIIKKSNLFRYALKAFPSLWLEEKDWTEGEKYFWDVSKSLIHKSPTFQKMIGSRKRGMYLIQHLLEDLIVLNSHDQSSFVQQIKDIKSGLPSYIEDVYRDQPARAKAISHAVLSPDPQTNLKEKGILFEKYFARASMMYLQLINQVRENFPEMIDALSFYYGKEAEYLLNKNFQDSPRAVINLFSPHYSSPSRGLPLWKDLLGYDIAENWGHGPSEKVRLSWVHEDRIKGLSRHEDFYADLKQKTLPFNPNEYFNHIQRPLTELEKEVLNRRFIDPMLLPTPQLEGHGRLVSNIAIEFECDFLAEKAFLFELSSHSEKSNAPFWQSKGVSEYFWHILDLNNGPFAQNDMLLSFFLSTISQDRLYHFIISSPEKSLSWRDKKQNNLLHLLLINTPRHASSRQMENISSYEELAKKNLLSLFVEKNQQGIFPLNMIEQPKIKMMLDKRLIAKEIKEGVKESGEKKLSASKRKM